MTQSKEASLQITLRNLKLPAFVAYHEEIALRAEQQGWSFGQYLSHLAEIEVEERTQRRRERNLKRSDLPREKTLETLALERFPQRIRRQVPALCEGRFVDKAENVLVFGLPGRGKSHLVCGIGVCQHSCRL